MGGASYPLSLVLLKAGFREVVDVCNTTQLRKPAWDKGESLVNPKSAVKNTL
jgi:hypothetical protein